MYHQGFLASLLPIGVTIFFTSSSLFYPLLILHQMCFSHFTMFFKLNHLLRYSFNDSITVNTQHFSKIMLNWGLQKTSL